jgi:hypothetical protein
MKPVKKAFSYHLGDVRSVGIVMGKYISWFVPYIQALCSLKLVHYWIIFKAKSTSFNLVDYHPEPPKNMRRVGRFSFYNFYIPKKN